MSRDIPCLECGKRPWHHPVDCPRRGKLPIGASLSIVSCSGCVLVKELQRQTTHIFDPSLGASMVQNGGIGHLDYIGEAARLFVEEGHNATKALEKTQSDGRAFVGEWWSAVRRVLKEIDAGP